MKKTKEINDIKYAVYQRHAVVESCQRTAKVANVLPKVEGKPVTRVAKEAFCYCQSLESVTIPDSIKEIGDMAFFKCLSLRKVVIPNSVKKIRCNVFYGCTSLTDITMSDTIEEISINAFYSCPRITQVNFSQKLLNRPDAKKILQQMWNEGLQTPEVLLGIATM